ncbi:hypothetical protein [Burkholderia ubonensis]|uniref:hypothetical protein n=1 Tax=Burkholderia ubonensis TaxID=101571 RepID=UPI000AC97046|nr:hypothetical protein [Burkholderia ubonensis]
MTDKLTEFDALLEDLEGAIAETAVFNATQRSMTVRMVRPRREKLMNFVRALLAAPTQQPSDTHRIDDHEVVLGKCIKCGAPIQQAAADQVAHDRKMVAPADERAALDVFSPFNACMYRDECRARAAASPTAAADVTDDMVTRFLGWRVPDDFAPDAGISFKPPINPDLWPVGTNLLTAPQARQMLEHVLAAPQPAQADALDTIPDECAASGASCSYAPEGRHGEMQCRYCGKAQAGAPAEAREQPKSLAEVWDSALEQIKTDPALLARLRAAIDSAPADARSGDAIARSKRILALVDDYHEKPTSDNRTSLRKALMAEFETAPPTARVASLTDEQREAIKFAVTWFDQSVLPNTPYSGYSKALHALLNGADHDQ